jgi:uncharacterized membrane protein
MKLIGRTLAILAAALVIVGVLFAIGSIGASATGTAADGAIGMGHEMQGGFNLAGIVQILPMLAVVGIITAIVAPIKQRLESKRQSNKLSSRRPAPTIATPSV